jgi:hypothetical protein
VFRKRGFTSRSELARTYARAAPPDPPPAAG